MPRSGGNSLVPLPMSSLLAGSHRFFPLAYFLLVVTICFIFHSLSSFLQALASALPLHSHCTFSAGAAAEQVSTVCPVWQLSACVLLPDSFTDGPRSSP